MRNNTENIFDCQKFGVKYFPIDNNDLWRVNYLKKLYESKNSLKIIGYSEDELNDIIEFVACN